MNKTVAITVENISKKYNIGNFRSQSFRESLSNLFSVRDKQKSTFWALQNINFEINHGESVGIIGRNGAGKSTLLKILSRITQPTTGRMEIDGRIASLLEVGTGFHPELTGRENIYLNGTILGMTRKEVKSKFEEIVFFSGIERFIDTPVKHYSSGMYVRLAFSVAAHLEPEVLIVDEVLAVGDMEFQKKCLGKMDDIAGQGRTVIFVSHNMEAVKRLCSRCIVLKSGSTIFDGKPEESIQYYFSDTLGAKRNFHDLVLEENDVKLNNIQLLNRNDKNSDIFEVSEPIKLKFNLEFKTEYSGIRIVWQLINTEGTILFATALHDSISGQNVFGKYCFQSIVPANLLKQGTYVVKVNIGIPGTTFLISPTEIIKINVTGINHDSIYLENWPGVISPRIENKLVKQS